MSLREALRAELGDRFVLVAARVEPDAIGCVIVTPHSAAEGVQARPRPRTRPARALAVSIRESLVPGRGHGDGEPAARDSRPSSTGRRSSCTRCSRRGRRRGGRRASDFSARSSSSRPWRRRARPSRAFVIVGWTPRERVPELRLELERAAGGELALDELSTPSEIEPPVLMRNRGLARPFEFLVRFLDLPRAGTLDPTVLMALFLPLMVGVMVGDIVYGTLLLVDRALRAAALRRRLGGGSRSQPRLRRRGPVGDRLRLSLRRGARRRRPQARAARAVVLPGRRGRRPAAAPVLARARGCARRSRAAARPVAVGERAPDGRARQPLRVAARPRRRRSRSPVSPRTAYPVGCSRRCSPARPWRPASCS